MVIFIILILLCRIQKTRLKQSFYSSVLKRDSKSDVVTNSIMNIANECKYYRIKNLFTSVLIITNYLYSNFIKSVNNSLKLDCTNIVGI